MNHFEPEYETGCNIMPEKAQDPMKKQRVTRDASQIGVDIFLLFRDGILLDEAKTWLKLYIKRHAAKALETGSLDNAQLRLTHITGEGIDAAPVGTLFHGSASKQSRFGELKPNEKMQLQLHGLISFLLFAREYPAIIITEGEEIERLCSGPDGVSHIQDLRDDAFIIFVTDRKGMACARRQQLHAVPWEDQSQEPVIERTFLFNRTRQIKGFSSVTHEVRRKVTSYGKKAENRKTHHPVLIIGESRTGKELIANALYRVSGLEKGRFIAVACGTFTQGLLLSEIFGYWPGAFTSSDSHGGMGLIQSAAKGALLVDDMDAADDPAGLQGAFLRCLITDPPQYRRVGARPLKKPLSETADTWLMFTLNKPVREMIRSGKLREDFLFRFQRIIQSPRLSARPADIPQIALSLWKKSRSDGRPLTIPTLRHLRYLNTDWGANAGELQALLLLAQECLGENKLLTWTEAIDRVLEKGEDYLTWYENDPKRPVSSVQEPGRIGWASEKPGNRPLPSLQDPKARMAQPHIPSCELPKNTDDLIDVLKREIRTRPNTGLEIDVVKRVYRLHGQESVCEGERLEKRNYIEGYRHWYVLGTEHKDDADNESGLVRLLKRAYAEDTISRLIQSIGKETPSGKIHPYKVLLFLALHPDNSVKRKEMSAFLWDRKGNKPLTSFETHREILSRLMGITREKGPALRKGTVYQNHLLVLEYIGNEWILRLLAREKDISQ